MTVYLRKSEDFCEQWGMGVYGV